MPQGGVFLASAGGFVGDPVQGYQGRAIAIFFAGSTVTRDSELGNSELGNSELGTTELGTRNTEHGNSEHGTRELGPRNTGTRNT